MGKIINFLEVRQKLELTGLASALKWEQNREKTASETPHTGPRKRPCVVSALPGETIPPEFSDFRPTLQRDGLILLGWSRWNISPYYYLRKSPCYVVNWITSAPNRHYRRYNTNYILQEEIDTAKPDKTGDPYFLLGICGKPFDFKHVKDKDVADYVFICAPWDLNTRTIPAFITELKAAGAKTDFDYRFTLGGQRELEFTAALRECKVISPHPCAWGKVEL
jgi:hypothetical protein